MWPKSPLTCRYPSGPAALADAKTMGSIGSFDPQKLIDAQKLGNPTGPAALEHLRRAGGDVTYVVGFFATAGAAGVDFGTNSRDKNDVQMGGLVGIALAIIVTAGISLLIVAGTYGSPDSRPRRLATAS